MLVKDIYITHRLTFPKGMKNDAYRHGRRFSGIVLALSGSIDYILTGKNAGEVIHFTAGQLMYLPELSCYITDNPTEAFDHYTLNFELCENSTASSDCSDKGGREKVIGAMFGTKPIVITPDSLPEISHLCEKAVESRHNVTGFPDLACRAVIYTLLSMFADYISCPKTHNPVHNAVLPAKRRIDEDICDDSSVEELAGLCSMSGTHFRRCFRDAFGVSPSEYRQNVRLARAKELLFTRLYRISEVAEMCGYNDANYFARIFKSKTGKTPAEYMNSR